MLLAIDIGNTNIAVGGIEARKIVFRADIAADGHKTSDQYGIELLNILRMFQLTKDQIEDCVISSASGPILDLVRGGVLKWLGCSSKVIDPAYRSVVSLKIDWPSELGSNIFAAITGAAADFVLPLILIYMGTATTVCVLDSETNYLGGCIIPGVVTSLDGLMSKTAQLPNVSLEVPKKVIGTNTISSIQSGLLHGSAAMLDKLIERIEDEIAFSCSVVACGVMAQYVVPLCRRKIDVDQELVMKGLSILHEKFYSGRSLK